MFILLLVFFEVKDNDLSLDSSNQFIAMHSLDAFHCKANFCVSQTWAQEKAQCNGKGNSNGKPEIKI